MKKLVLSRFGFKREYIIGHLYSNNVYICDTLEPPFRDCHSCLDFGVYDVSLMRSPKLSQRFPYNHINNGLIPRVIGVRDNSILIHIGNDVNDTNGCILVGYNKQVGKVLHSTDAFRQLMNILVPSDKITLTINYF